MEMIKTDNLIVGGGPAGSLCGIRLRQEGRDSLIVDRAEFPRVKLCAGVLTAKSRQVLADVLGKDACASLLQESCRCRESHLRIWDGRHCFVDCDFTDSRQIPQRWRDDDWRFLLVDRPDFDFWLIRYYRSLDGKVIEGDGIRDIDFENRRAVLASGQTISYENLIACDGATSHVEHLLGKHDHSFLSKKASSEAFEINVDRADIDIDGINVCFGYVPQTYAWAFAKGDKVCLGTMRMSGTRFSAREAMRRFCADLGLRHQEKYPLQAAMIPVDNAMPVPLWHDSVYFCGDAAGLNEAVTAEGIYYALRSGTDAAEAIVSGSPQIYLDRNRRLQALMRKASRYQKLIASRRLFPLFKAIASHNQRFVGYFYLTQIDHSSLDHAASIFWQYMRDLLHP